MQLIARKHLKFYMYSISQVSGNQNGTLSSNVDEFGFLLGRLHYLSSLKQLIMQKENSEFKPAILR